MSAFLIADVDVTDLDHYRESGYLESVPILAAKYGGQYRVRGPNIEVLEGDWPLHRLVIIEFPDMPRLRDFYDSEAYRPYRRIRHHLTRSRLIAVEGVPETQGEIAD